MNYFVEDVNVLSLLFNSLNDDTKIHSYNVANYALAFAQSLNINGNELMCYYSYGLYHDIGKLCIDTKILTKNSSLTNEEYNIIKQHTVYGESIIKHIIFQNDDYKNKLLDVVRHHHERIDENGYPDKLHKEDISLEVKIVTVADVCDAILTDRCYQDGMGLNYLLRVLEENAGTQFDEEIVKIAINYFQHKFKL